MSGAFMCEKAAEIAVMASDVSTIKSDIHEMKHAIIGNGQPGIKTIVAKHDQLLTGIMWAVGLIGTSVAGIAVALISQFLGGFHR